MTEDCVPQTCPSNAESPWGSCSQGARTRTTGHENMSLQFSQVITGTMIKEYAM
jgi:hypothetical protein